MPDNDSFPEKYDKLLDEFQQLEAELKKARRTIEIKEIELKAVLAQSHEISNSDVLTFLPNRRKIIGDLQAEVYGVGVLVQSQSQTGDEASPEQCCYPGKPGGGALVCAAFVRRRFSHAKSPWALGKQTACQRRMY